jgi:type IV secretion system protein VirD4
VSETDQRRALLLPQELVQMSDRELIVLKAGLPPVRGRKLRYYAEPVFRRRLHPAPVVPPIRLPTASEPDDQPAADPADPLTLAAIAPLIAAEGHEPLPRDGATPAEVEAWVERFIDASATPSPKELPHG